jgi:hypothetical protein
VALTRKRWFGEGVDRGTPLDAVPDAAEASISVGMRDLCCRLNGNARNFEKAAENLAQAGQVYLSGETLRQVVEREGQRALALAQALGRRQRRGRNGLGGHGTKRTVVSILENHPGTAKLTPSRKTCRAQMSRWGSPSFKALRGAV